MIVCFVSAAYTHFYAWVLYDPKFVAARQVSVSCEGGEGSLQALQGKVTVFTVIQAHRTFHVAEQAGNKLAPWKDFMF